MTAVIAIAAAVLVAALVVLVARRTRAGAAPPAAREEVSALAGGDGPGRARADGPGPASVASVASAGPEPAAAEPPAPVAAEPVEAARAPMEAASAPAPAMNGNGAAPRRTVEDAPAASGARTVLVVDDEAFVRATTARILTLAGFDVLQASSAADALAIGAAHDQQIHALLSDVVMPEMSGFELAEEARRVWPETAVILFSAYTAAALERHKLRKSADMKVLMKPVEPAELIDAVTAAIDAANG